jgi:hypothetical protein
MASTLANFRYGATKLGSFNGGILVGQSPPASLWYDDPRRTRLRRCAGQRL